MSLCARVILGNFPHTTLQRGGLPLPIPHRHRHHHHNHLHDLHHRRHIIIIMMFNQLITDINMYGYYRSRIFSKSPHLFPNQFDLEQSKSFPIG